MNCKTWSVLALILACAASSMCGGNCPSGNCQSCLCGSKPCMTSITTYCSLHWSKTAYACCLCISAIESGQQQCYMNQGEYGYEVGCLPVDQIDIDDARCTTSLKKSCTVHPGAACAYKVYKLDGGWSRWEDAARRCGCPVDENNPRLLKKKAILQKKKDLKAEKKVIKQ